MRKYQALRRFVIRNALASLSREGLLDNQPDWFWEALFEIFTYE